MFAKYLTGSSLVLGLIVGSVMAADKKAEDCCSLKLACCTNPSACCVADAKLGCCENGQKCCAENKACCAAVQKCCSNGAKCCDEAKACCGPSARHESACCVAAAKPGCCEQS